MSKSILIVDPDLGFYESLKKDPLVKDIPFHHVYTGSEAQKLLKEEKDKYSCCLISPEVRSPNGVAVIRFALTYQPTLPLYLIESMNIELAESVDIESLGLQGKISKPFNLKGLKSHLGSIIDFFDAESVIQNASTTDKVGEELESSESDYRPIKAELFVSGSKSLFDIYVKLRKDKFIKIVQGGDTFDVERVMEYLKKGVTHFYIRKEALESYVQYCDRLTNIVAKNEKLETNKKMGFLFNQGEVTLKAMVDIGVDNDSLIHAQKYFKNTCQVITKISEENSFLSDLLKQMSDFEHSSAMVIVTSIVAKAAGIETDKSLEALGIASLLHDVGMVAQVKKGSDPYSDAADKLFDEDEVLEKILSKKLFGDEKNMYENMFYSHAERGAAQLDNIKGIPAIVPQIIRQHHAHMEKEMKRYTGSPIIHPLAEIIEICDHFVRIMKKFSKADIPDQKRAIMEAMLQKVSDFPRRTRTPFMEAFKFTK
jgi:HD-GYP domain-containing protein (c-di-GMP phosphodiesterase class II)